MQLCDINPYMRYAELQPSVMSSAPLSCSYDYRLFYILEGNAEFVMEDRSLPLTPGTLLYFRPGTPYYFEGKVKVIVLNFDMTRRKSDQTKPISPSRDVASFDPLLVFENKPPQELERLILVPHAEDVENKMQECLLHYRYPTPFSDAATSAIIKELLCYAVQNANHHAKELPELVQRITLYIQQNYDRELSNEQISAEFGYHSFYLNRIFKAGTGITIHQAVLAERMRIAKRLLRHTKLSIHEIASEVGFADRSQFCTAFRKQIGRTPTEYRNRK